MARSKRKSKAKKRSLAGQHNHNKEDVLATQRAGAKRILEELHYKRRINDVEKAVTSDNNDNTSIPRSMVVKNGRINTSLRQLVLDLRKMMSPYTALKLKERNKANLKDYVAVSGHVSFFFQFLFA